MQTTVFNLVSVIMPECTELQNLPLAGHRFSKQLILGDKQQRTWLLLWLPLTSPVKQC